MLDQFLYNLPSPDDQNPPASPYASAASQSAIDDLLNQKTHILSVKLAVFASEIVDRVRVRTRSLEHIGADEAEVQEMILRTDRQAQYHLREHQDKRVLYEILFELRQERRSQDVECWRDVVDAMRDFLTTWESLEQARARSLFLNHVGR